MRTLPWWFWIFPSIILFDVLMIPLFGLWLRRYDEKHTHERMPGWP